MPKPLAGSDAGRTADDYTIVVAYDGERTEDEYFRGWKLIIPPSRMTLVPLYVKSGGNVLKAVEKAVQCKKRTGPHAEFWCVCDRDETTDEDVAKAVELANQKGVRLCLSVRSFEIWIELHFCKTSAPITDGEEAISRVARHIEYSKKAKSVAFVTLLPRTKTALENAKWLREQGTTNPKTDVDALVNKITQNCEGLSFAQSK